jgi:hypothetical protein
MLESTEDAWSQIGLLFSRDVLERRYKARHGGDINAAKANEIISHLEQAQQYWRSAETAGDLAKPLEQYYGVLAFSRALILFLSPDAKEATLHKMHGLRASIRDGGDIEDIQLTVQSGTFSELLHATANVQESIVDLPSPGKPLQRTAVLRSLRQPEPGSTFSFINLLSRISDLQSHFESAFGKCADCFAGYAWWMMNTLSIGIYKGECALPEPAELRIALGIPSTATINVTPEGDPAIRFDVQIPHGSRIVDFLPLTIETRSGARTVVAAFREGWYLNELMSYFACSHALSMIVRYYPTLWRNLRARKKGDKILPLIEKMSLLIQSEFIWLGLREFERNPAVES